MLESSADILQDGVALFLVAVQIISGFPTGKADTSPLCSTEGRMTQRRHPELTDVCVCVCVHIYSRKSSAHIEVAQEQSCSEVLHRLRFSGV